MRRVSWRFCFVVTLIAFFGFILFEPLRPDGDHLAPIDYIVHGIKPVWLAVAVAISIVVVLVIVSSYALSEAWNRIAPKLFPGVGELTWGEAYVVMLILSFFV